MPLTSAHLPPLFNHERINLPKPDGGLLRAHKKEHEQPAPLIGCQLRLPLPNSRALLGRPVHPQHGHCTTSSVGLLSGHARSRKKKKASNQGNDTLFAHNRSDRQGQVLAAPTGATGRDAKPIKSRSLHSTYAQWRFAAEPSLRSAHAQSRPHGGNKQKESTRASNAHRPPVARPTKQWKCQAKKKKKIHRNSDVLAVDQPLQRHPRCHRPQPLSQRQGHVASAGGMRVCRSNRRQAGEWITTSKPSVTSSDR